MKVIKFEISSRFGHFRHFNTTTSPLTYVIPPKPAVIGIIGAILGIDKTEYLDVLKNTKIGIKMDKVPEKTIFPINIVNTAKGHIFPLQQKNPRSRIRYQFLVNPKYYIYVNIDDENILELEERLKTHKPVYIPFIGISECIANIKYLGTWNAERTSDTKIQNCVCRTLRNPGGVVVSEYQCLEMKNGRIPTKFGYVYWGDIDTNDDVYVVDNENVVLF